MADDRTAAHGELGLKSLQAKKLAKDAAHLGTLVLSLDMNLESQARELGKGPEQAAIVEAGANLGSAIRSMGEAEENRKLAGATLERAGSPLYHYSYDRTRAAADPLERAKIVHGIATRNLTSDLREMESAAEMVGRLDGGEGVARMLLGLHRSMVGQLKELVWAGEAFGKTARVAHGAKPPPGFREDPSTGELFCPHRDVSCCLSCAKKHPEVVEVGGQYFWTHSPAEKAELLRLQHKK